MSEFLRRTGEIALGSAVSLTVGTGIASAHGSSSSGTGQFQPFVVVIGVCCAGLLAGFISLFGAESARHASSQKIAGLVGVGMIVVGASLPLSVVGQAMTATSVGLSAGLVIGGIGVRRHHCGANESSCRRADTVTGAVGTHRLIEGGLLGSLMATGGQLTPAVAAVLGGHVIVEMLIVGQLYSTATVPMRGAIVICMTQLGFVAMSVLTATAIESIPVSMVPIVLSTAGGVLVVFGLHECLTQGTTARPLVPRSG